MASKSGKAKGRRDRGTGTARKQAAEGPSFWDQLSSRVRHLILVGLLAVVSAVFFAPVTFEGRQLTGSDVFQSRAMAKSMYEYTAETGEPALWATNIFSGMPGFLISYPPVVLQIDKIMFWFRRHFWPVGQFFLLLLGVYTLVHYLTANSLAAFVAALGAGLTTYVPVILSVGHTSKFMAISWLPWLFVVFVRTMRNPRVISAALFAMILAVELRSGHPQITYYAAWFMAIWWICETVPLVRGGQVREAAISTGILTIGVVLATLMAAQPYLAQFEFKQYTIRGAAGVSDNAVSGLAWDYAMNWSQGISELLTLFIADTFGGGSSTYWGEKLFTEGPHYVGGIMLLLALVAVVGRRERTIRGLALGAVILTLFALGKNAAWINRPLFDHFPLFSAFRAPEMWLHLVELAVAILAGMGAAYLVGNDGQSRRRRVALSSAGGLLAVSLVFTVAGTQFLSFERPQEGARAAQQLALREGMSPADPAVQAAVGRYLSTVRSERQELFEKDAVRTTIVLLIATALIWLYFSGRIRPWIMMAGLSLVVLVDLWGVGQRQIQRSDYVEGMLDDAIPTYAFDRFILDRVSDAGGPGHFRTLSLEQSPINWARPAFYYELSGGYNAAKLRVYQDFIDNVFFDPRTGMPTELGLDLTGTRYVVSARPIAGAHSAYVDTEESLVVFERDNPRPRNVLVGSYQVVDPGEETFRAMQSAGFDAGSQVLLATEPDAEISPIDSASTAEVALVDYGPHEIEWEVESDAARVLVTSEVYYPAGWNATIDGTPVPILRANHSFRAVVVPAGTHRVVMRFEPRSHTMGVLISAISTTLVYAWLIISVFLAFLRRKRPTQ